MQKKFTSIIALCILCSNMNIAQTIRNFGNAQAHNNVNLGVYNSLINDGILVSSSGLLGFYGDKNISLSGSKTPFLFDIEIANENGILLDTSIIITNNINFIYGNVFSNRNQPFHFLDLQEGAGYQGESNFSKIDGFIQATVNENHLFPTGDKTFLRPLKVDNTGVNTVLKCAYFFKNPVNTFSLSENFSSEIAGVNRHEFWTLDGNKPLKLTIGWNRRSSIFELTQQVQNLTVSGYYKETKTWVSLGADEITGNINEGFITSDLFIPNEYEAFTFGSVKEKIVSSVKGYHYLITPNGDGINDFLYIPELENYKTNRLQIYNRNGRKVFEAEDYSNEFGGSSNTLKKSKKLLPGVYFYIVYLPDETITFQGFLYLDQ